MRFLGKTGLNALTAILCASFLTACFSLAPKWKPDFKDEHGVRDKYDDINMCYPKILKRMNKNYRYIQGVQEGVFMEEVVEPEVLGKPDFSRKEELRDGRKLDLLYYMIAHEGCNIVISDYKFAPIVFEGGRVIGAGNDFYYDVIKPNLD